MKSRYPTCPHCGDHVLREHLNNGDEVCRFCGPTRDLDTYGELEAEIFNKWYGEYIMKEGLKDACKR